MEARAIALATTDANAAALDRLAEPTVDGALNLLASREAERRHLFHYRQDLEDCALANPIARTSLEWVGDRFESIEPANVEHEHVLEFLLPDRASWCSPPCRRLTSDVSPLGMNELIKGVLPPLDGRVWLLFRDGSTRIVNREGDFTIGCRLQLEGWTELSALVRFFIRAISAGVHRRRVFTSALGEELHPSAPGSSSPRLPPVHVPSIKAYDP